MINDNMIVPEPPYAEGFITAGHKWYDKPPKCTYTTVRYTATFFGTKCAEIMDRIFYMEWTGQNLPAYQIINKFNELGGTNWKYTLLSID